MKPSNTKSLESLYQRLADEEDARVCKDIPESACRVVPGNFFKILIAQFVNSIADTLSSAKLILPWLMASAGVPAFFSGLLVPIRESGSLLPQLIFAGYIRKFAKRKWFFAFGAAAQGIGALCLAWVAFSLDGFSAGLAIVSLLVVISLARGICSVASKDVLGKTIPKTRRGLVSGYSSSSAGFVTLILGIVLYLNWTQQLNNYAILLFIAAVLYFLAGVFYGTIDEQEGETDGGANAFSSAMKSASLLKTDKNFRRFVITRALMMSSGLSAPFFITLAHSSMAEANQSALGLFILVGGLASLLSAVVWGKFADRSSRKVMLTTAGLTALFCTGACVVSLMAESPSFYIMLVLYFLLAITHEGVRLGRKTYVIDLAGGNRRTDYVAVSNTAIGVLLLVWGLISAAIAQLSISLVLGLFAASAILAVFMSLKLPEAQD
ncbi:MFS transporter [Sessilibacter sp. MAH1]